MRKIPRYSGRWPKFTTTCVIQYRIPTQPVIPAIHPRSSERHTDSTSFRAINKGTRANQATTPRPNFGKDKKSRTPLKTAKKIRYALSLLSESSCVACRSLFFMGKSFIHFFYFHFFYATFVRIFNGDVHSFDLKIFPPVRDSPDCV